MIERQITLGLITSTDFLRQLQRIWDPALLESSTARLVASWCWEYFDQYQRAPIKDFEGIYYQKLRDGHLQKDLAKELEEEILPGLSKEFEASPPNIDYLLTQTKQYLRERHLLLFADNLKAVIERGQGDESQRVTQAEQLAGEYRPLMTESEDGLDLSNEAVLERIDHAFETTGDPIVRYPGKLGEFWNSQFLPGKFVAFLGIEKRGKTWLLLDLALRACRHGVPVAFFSAGDMTETEVLMRICIYETQKSNLPKYCGTQYEPVRDCVYNQLNDCKREDRANGFGIFEERDEEWLREDLTMEHLIKAYDENPDYKPCGNCDEYARCHWGTPWLTKTDVGEALTAEEAKGAVNRFFIQQQRHFKLSTHPNDTLSVKQIRALLDVWERQDGFVPQLIVIDYADLLIYEGFERDFRHQQNKIWKNLRRLSQEKNKPLVVTATLADSESYEKSHLKMSNFSEDHRKYAHVTAFYGLNQDPKDREAHIGLLRINAIVIREGERNTGNEVTVLQNLRRGRPFIGSYL